MMFVEAVRLTRAVDRYYHVDCPFQRVHRGVSTEGDITTLRPTKSP
jgi:hypothetical protein